VAEPRATTKKPEGRVLSLPSGRRGFEWDRLLPFLPLLAVLILWYVGGLFYEVYVLPDPLETLAALSSLVRAGIFGATLAATFYHVLSSFALSALVGTSLGILMGRVRLAELAGKNLMPVLQTIPGLVLVTVAIIIFKFTDSGIIFVGFVFGLPNMVIGVWQGAKNVDANLIEMARVYGHTERSIMRRVILPSVLPDVISSMRVTMGILWHVVLFAEFIMGQSGFGRQIANSLAMFEYPDIFAWGLSVVVIMVLLEYGFFRPIERRLMAWKKRAAMV
jgi:NitT/TauT family transport system permease protein